MGRRPNVRYNNGGVDLPERGPGIIFKIEEY